MDKKSKTLGMLIGRQIAGMRRAKQEPVAYLYNGVRLPALPPEKQEYPYAIIAYYENVSGGNFARLAISTELINYVYLDDLYIVNKYTTSGTAKVFMWVSETLDIEDFDSHFAIPDGLTANKWCGFDESVTGEIFGDTGVVWANHDIMRLPDRIKPEGEVKLYASEPIPVYE